MYSDEQIDKAIELIEERIKKPFNSLPVGLQDYYLEGQLQCLEK